MFNHTLLLAASLSLTAPAFATPTIIWNAASDGFSDNLALRLQPHSTFEPYRFGYSDVSSWYASQAYTFTDHDRRFLIGLADDGQAIDVLYTIAADGETAMVGAGRGPWTWRDDGGVVVDAEGFVSWHAPEPSAALLLVFAGMRRSLRR